MFDRINSHLTKNNLHCPTQYGYKKNHSCETLLLKMIDDIMVAVDGKSGVVLLILDLSAAFDTVDHTKLLQILYSQFHISGNALKWLKAFLSGRSQRVKVGNVSSDSLDILFGVPQGSILGPLLFNLYCSSLSQAFSYSGFDCAGYADDNFGYRAFPAFCSLSTLLNALPRCLSAINSWTASHFLKLNCDKTHVMVFGSKGFKSRANIPGWLNNSGVLCPLTNSTKVLGVHIDDKLSFDDHVSKVATSCYMALRNIFLIRKFLSKDSAATAIHAFVTSKLDMCDSLFFGMTQRNIAKLQHIQNLAACIVSGNNSGISPETLLKQLHWLTIEQRIHFKVLVLVFRCLNSSALFPLAVKLVLTCPLDMLLSCNSFTPTSTLGRRAFSYNAPRCWNALPRQLRVIPCLETFKAQLKTHFFSNFPVYLHKVNPYT